MKLSQEAAPRRRREAERSCGQVRGDRGRAQRRLKSQPRTCYLRAPLLAHRAGKHPKNAEKPTVPHAATLQVCCSDVMTDVLQLKSHCVQRTPALVCC